MSKTVLAFDLYGTLLSTNSISKALAEHYGAAKADSIAQLWRRYQIEYTFRLNKQYEDFETVTRKSLLHTLGEHRLEMKDKDVDSIMQAYDNLSTFPDVVPALQTLSQMANLDLVVLSNGTRRMIEKSVNGSDDLNGISSVFSRLISIDHVRSFKPAPEVYRYLTHCVNMAGQERQIWLVSGNPFDVVGAVSAGLNAAWVDRAGNGWHDKLGPKPTKIVSGLSDLIDLVKEI